jgi:hypothetical protein
VATRPFLTDTRCRPTAELAKCTPSQSGPVLNITKKKVKEFSRPRVHEDAQDS